MKFGIGEASSTSTPMVGLTACGRLSCSSVIPQSKSFAIRSKIASVPSFGLESNAPEQRIVAEDNPFVKPLSNVYSVVPCRFCKGSGEVKCNVCEGQGKLARGGFHKRNPVAMVHIVGSNWTAMERTFGRHHFHVYSKRRGPGKDWFLEMVSACDETTRFWINAKILKDRERWSAGWLQRGELQGIEGSRQKLEEAATICKACKGRRTQPCHMCTKLEEARELDIIDV